MLQEPESYWVEMTMCCAVCGSSLCEEYFQVDTNRKITVKAALCAQCASIAWKNGYTQGYEEGNEDSLVRSL